MTAQSPVRRKGSLLAAIVLLVGGLAAVTASPAQATTTFTNYTTANGLGSNQVNGVYAVGSTIYAATSGGLSISTNGGTNFTNRTTANGLGSNTVFGVYADGSTIYAATSGGLSIYVEPTGSTPPPVDITVNVTAGYRCTTTLVSGNQGTWATLPVASDCTPPASKPNATLLGWATQANFPVAIAKRQVDNGWGAYETFDSTGQLTGVFIPVGNPTWLSSPGQIYSIWSE